jgi:hypothetical protein
MSTLWTSVPLESNTTAIRVFTIDSVDHGTSLQCTFRTVSLSEAPSFAAISYTWRTALGPRERSSEDALSTQSKGKVTCNGFEVQILDNLHHALRRLWTSCSRGTEFWADALCIDQGNIPERNHQVAAMAEIFKTAQKVYIWLGRSTPTIGLAIEFVELMASLSAEAMQAFAYGELSANLSDETRVKLGRKEYWEALELFFSRSWFIRAWIVQETLLAQHLTVMCGDQTIAWEKLWLTSVYLLRFAQNLAPFHPACFRENVYFDIPARLEAGRNNQFARGKDGLLYSLIRSRKHVCFDCRDTVFSVIGIARVKTAHHYEDEDTLPVPDYAATATSVFRQTAVHIIGTSENLLLLAYAEGRSSRNIDGLPSWVPDWSVRKALGLAYTGYKSFEADGGRPRYAELRFDKRILAIEVTMVDEVSMIGETKDSVLRTGDFPKWLAMIASLQPTASHGQMRKEIFWRTLLTDIVPDHNGLQHPAPAEFEHLFDSWLLSCVETAQRNAKESSQESVRDALYATALRYGLQWLCDLLTKATATEADGIQAARFRTVYSNALHVRLFRTAKGFLGVGTESIEESDVVCIASGSRVPLVLRRRQGVVVESAIGVARYELVGAAYVHSWMHGEALRGLGSGFRVVEIE